MLLWLHDRQKKKTPFLLVNGFENKAFKCSHTYVGRDILNHRLYVAEADPRFSERGSEHRSVSLMQVVWGRSPPAAIGFFVIITLNSCLL